MTAMTDLSFAVLGARAEPYAAVPTLMLRLRISEETGERIHTLALRCQIQIEPRRRPYSEPEEERLLELFGEPARWGQTLKTILWTHVSVMVPGFEGSIEIDLPVTCTYDFEVTAAKYFHGLDEGEIPLLLLFSGTAFTRGQTGFSVAAGAVGEGGGLPPARLGLAGRHGPLLPGQRLDPPAAGHVRRSPQFPGAAGSADLGGRHRGPSS